MHLSLPPAHDAVSFQAAYGLGLGLLILSGNLTSSLLLLFCRADAYTLGNFGLNLQIEKRNGWREGRKEEGEKKREMC